VLAFVAFWLGIATISMHQFPTWQLSWWLYHFILLFGFLVTIYILLAQYEQARQFSLLRYYLATSLIVTALVALAASFVFAQFAQVVTGQAVEQGVLHARQIGLLITALSMSLLFGALLIVVARADRIISHRSRELAVVNENLRQSEALRNDLTHMIVHDLRSPLTAIYGTLGLIRLLNDVEHADQRLYHINQAIQASERLTGLVDDILNVSKIEAGQFEPDIAPVSVATLLTERLQHFTVQAKAENKKLLPDYPSPFNGWLDANLIGRVVDNLVSNALKYTRTGGKIQVSAWAEDSQLYVRVRDDGDGIPDNYKRTIFEKFAQVPSANHTPKRKGTGLGLTFCGLAVDLHGGKIWIEDAPDGGSDFIFRLPQNPPPAQSSPHTDLIS
jgi:signal transduction histidine kinase